MELITSGLEAMPSRLSPKGIYCLSFHEHEKIQETLFCIQVITIRHGGKSISAEDSDEQTQAMKNKQFQKYLAEQTTNQGLQLEVSDGIGTATALISREAVSELQMYGKMININSVLVIRG